jgi:hypothetical protein
MSAIDNFATRGAEVPLLKPLGDTVLVEVVDTRRGLYDFSGFEVALTNNADLKRGERN